MPIISAIIVTYNRLSILRENINCIFSQEIKPDFVVIVDNASNDGTVEFLNSFSLQKIFPVFLKTNICFGGGLAEGIKIADREFVSDFYWLLDDDSLPEKSLLRFLLSQARRINQPGVFGLSGYVHFKGIPKRPKENSEGFSEVDFVLVDNALISKEVIEKAGSISVDFFMMCEDYEFCLRARKLGFPIFLLFPPTVMVNRLHLGSQNKSLIWRGYYHSRNHILILKKFYSFNGLLGYIHRHTKIIIHALLFGPYRFQKVKYRFLGIWDGILGVSGKTVDPKDFK